MKKKTVNEDIIISIFLILLSVAIFVMSKGFPVAAKRFPRFVAVLLCVLSFCLLGKTILQTRNNVGRKCYFTWKYLKYALIGFLFLLAYYFMIQLISFFPATTIIMIVLMVFLHVTNWKVILLTTACIDASAWFVFVKQLEIFLP